MMRVICLFALFYFSTIVVFAQTREELEKQRQQLKKEIDDAQKLLNSNKAATKESLSTFIILSNKADLQDRVVTNISKDLNILDNNIVGIQRDINKYDRLLDTLRQEYAKSMVYAYKNRGNYEFLNFIFSADNFNDAVKRIAYLKSYRTFREMQGQNIIRTQDLRRKRLEDLGVTKQTKSSTLLVQTEEMKKLEDQKAEQDRIVANLKKQGKDINARIAERQRQVARVNSEIKKAIARAIKEDNDRRIAAEKKRKADAAIETARLEKIRKAEELKNAKVNAGSTKTSDPVAVVKPPKPVKEIVVPESKDLNTEIVALNSSFERNKGNLPWPVDNGAVLSHFGKKILHSGAVMDNNSITISSAIGAPVKAVFDGVVILIAEPDDGKFTVTIKHGGYYTTYSNITNVSVKKDQAVSAREVLGKVASNLDGIGSIDFYSAKGYTDLDPEKWLKGR